MHIPRPSVLLAATAIAVAFAGPHAQAAGGRAARNPARHLVLTNATYDSIVSFAIAADGSDAYHVIDIGRPLQGGLNSITVDVPPGPCLRAFRVTFATGSIRDIAHFDLCRFHQLRLSVPPG